MLNLMIVILFTFFVALILIYFISSHDRKRAIKASKLAIMNDGNTETQMDFKEFQKVCMNICEGLKLEITDVSAASASEFNIRAISQNPITQVEYLIAGFHIPRTSELEVQRVIEMSDQVVAERISKGIVMTTGRINVAALRAIPELANLEYVDGQRLMQLSKEYSFLY